MDITLDFVKEIVALRDKSNETFQKIESSKEEATKKLFNKNDQIANKNIKEFLSFIEASDIKELEINIEGFNKTILFSVRKRRMWDNVSNVFWIKQNEIVQGFDGFGNHFVYQIDSDKRKMNCDSFHIDGKSVDGKFFLFVDHYDDVKLSVVNTIKEQINLNIEGSNKAVNEIKEIESKLSA